ncbi:uncharacterized protein Z519_12802 [Cladophialophora bantiana CBS 173.52]|uniref:Uncharacterized protein n=1 Tax=Cladophialophora bantiana (strain ATCC 10958 / CBS 173.52 / CDC B-1940 / NIH 8579) TaxID=1442370 RepID=A0A0D2H6V3_CLAB1|nr:uncharacterized protein Z519_12802 [Cladophialophora bantiana CBS 173.52]KIW86590.1 hypothetical protein Z519_12802 [Cladophialophora bantiana CBS 173.52]
MKCDGQYSESEYQSIERKKSELRNKVQEAQARMAQRAQWYAGEMARLAQQQSLELLQEQSRLSQVERQLDKLTQAQSDMTVRACMVLDRLDEEEGYAPDEPELPIAREFAFDDGQLDALLALGTTQGDPSLFSLEAPSKGLAVLNAFSENFLDIIFLGCYLLI